MIWTQTDSDTLVTLATAGKYRLADMASLLNTTKYNIKKRIKELGIKAVFRPKGKYTYNTSYFDTSTLESCYWAGILQTDGCLMRRRNSVTIVWACSVKDRGLMELFRSHISSTHPIITVYNRCGLSTKDKNKKHEGCRLSFEGASQWASSLKTHFGFDHNKTLRTAPPNLPSLLHKLAYIKGLWDGDGCITHSNSMGGIHLSLCGCNKELLVWVQQVIAELGLPTPYRRAAHINQAAGENCYYLNYTGLRGSVLHEILYRLPTPYLSRKWDAPKAMEHKAYWKNRPDIWPPEIFFTNLLKQG